MPSGEALFCVLRGKFDGLGNERNTKILIRNMSAIGAHLMHVSNATTILENSRSNED